MNRNIIIGYKKPLEKKCYLSNFIKRLSLVNSVSCLRTLAARNLSRLLSQTYYLTTLHASLLTTGGFNEAKRLLSEISFMNQEQRHKVVVVGTTAEFGIFESIAVLDCFMEKTIKW